ncbi:MAG: TetR/AcrR family transcriptional regulator [Bryobacteraceae bacterium]
MGVAERRAREKAELRQKILDAAGKLILENGYQNLSIRAIADIIEYSPSTIYLYFKDKADIVASICNEVFGQLTAKLRKVAAEEPDALRGLRQGLHCYIEFGLAHPSHYLVTFGTSWPKPADSDYASFTGASAAGLECFSLLGEAIGRAMAQGAIAEGDPMLMAQVAWTAIHGLTHLQIIMGDDPDFPWAPREVLVERLCDTILLGMQHPRAK